MSFSERLCELMKERSLNQSEFAKIYGVTRMTMSAYMNGRFTPTVQGLCDLADYFHVSTDYLLGRMDTK